MREGAILLWYTCKEKFKTTESSTLMPAYFHARLSARACWYIYVGYWLDIIDEGGRMMTVAAGEADTPQRSEE